LYYYANECSFKMQNCNGYVVHKDANKAAQVCYYSNTPCTSLIISAPKTWDKSFPCSGAYVRKV
jgi:hypothetical protein